MNKIRPKPIFIHALFKTGSSFLWSQFRQNKNYHCYYEPFHHFLLEIDKDFENKFIKRDTIFGKEHTKESHYLTEYAGLIRDGKVGLPFFKRDFIVERYCDNNDSADVKVYIDALIANAGEKRTVFQFNRSSLRIKWFKSNYPDSLHIYLLRNPRDQWESYVSKARKNRRIFVAYDLMIAGKNQKSDYFRKLADYVPLINFHDADFNAEIKFFQTLSDKYIDEDKYFIFYYIWLLAFLENCRYADVVIDMNSISEDIRYRRRLTELLQTYGINDALFGDAQMPIYNTHSLPPEVMRNIEITVQRIGLNLISNATLAKMKENVSIIAKNYLYDEKIAGTPAIIDRTEKINRLLIELNQALVKSSEDNTFYKRKCQVLLKRIGDLEKIYKSKTYKIGKVITDPVRKIRDALKCILN